MAGDKIALRQGTVLMGDGDGMRPQIDYYFSVISLCSYFGCLVFQDVVRRHEARVTFKPVAARGWLLGFLDTADQGTGLDAARSGLMKFSVTDNAIEAINLALKLAGIHGLTRRNPLERHHRDVLCGRIHAPQDDSILMAAGRAALTGTASR